MKKIKLILPIVLILLGLTGTAWCWRLRPNLAKTPDASQATLIPEFAPTEAILVSEILFNENFRGLDLAQEILATGTKLVIAMAQPFTEAEKLHWLREKKLDSLPRSENISVLHLSHDTQWIRDYGPLATLFFREPHGNVGIRFIDPQYKKEMDQDDQFPYMLAQTLQADLFHIPLHIDGGNFLTDGKNCYMSNDALQLIQFGNADVAKTTQDAENLLRGYLQSLGCQTLVLLKNAPHEHIDMYVKILNPTEALVSEIDQTTRNWLMQTQGFLSRDTRQLAQQLDDAAHQLQKYLRVTRIPMPLLYRNTMRSYTNGIIVNQTVILPRYQTFGWQGESYPDAELISYYEQKVSQVFTSHGFKVRFAPADGLIFNGGALHCVADQLFDISQWQTQQGQKKL